MTHYFEDVIGVLRQKDSLFSKLALEQMEHAKKRAELVFVDYQHFGIDHFEHALLNLKRAKSIFGLSSLQGALKNKPALICGGGSSIYDHGDLLKKIEKSAYVFAGGKGAKVLHEMGVPIDFIGAIDPHANYEGFEEISSKSHFVFYQDRVSPALIARAKAPLVFCGAPSGYDLLHFLYEQLGIDMVFEAGWDVSNFLFAIARYLGCSPIILAGQDHCYKTQEEALDTNMPLKKAQDKEGKACFIKDDFMMASIWFMEEVKGYEVYRIGQGFGLEGIPVFEEEVLFHSEKKLFSCHLNDQGFKKPLHKVLEEFLASLKRAMAHLEVWMGAIEHKDPRSLLHEIELKEEICYTHFLQPVWQIFKPVMGKEYEIPFYHDALTKMVKMVEHEILF